MLLCWFTSNKNVPERQEILFDISQFLRPPQHIPFNTSTRIFACNSGDRMLADQPILDITYSSHLVEREDHTLGTDRYDNLFLHGWNHCFPSKDVRRRRIESGGWRRGRKFKTYEVDWHNNRIIMCYKLG